MYRHSKSIALFLFSILPLMTAGCLIDGRKEKEDTAVETVADTAESLAVQDYGPLMVGAKWAFEVSLEENGATITSTDIYVISGTEDIGGVTYFVQHYIQDNQTGCERVYVDYFRIADNILYWGGGEPEDAVEFLDHDLPIEDYNRPVGESWDVDSGDTWTQTARFTRFEDVRVIAGVFEDCLKVKSIFRDTGDEAFTNVLTA